MHLRLQTIFDGYTLVIPDTSGKPTVSARFRSAVNPSSPLARCSAKKPPLAFLSPQASKALRDNRLVDAVPLLSILRSARAANLHVPPTHIGSCPCHSVRRLSLFTVCDAKPHASFVGSPGPMGDTPMHSLHFGRRPTAYVNFEWPPAHGAEGSANSQTASGF